MGIEIRPVSGDERRDIILRLGGYAFGPTPPLPFDNEFWQGFVRISEGAPNLVAFEDGQAVAMVHSTPMTQHVRGKIVPMGGVWAVATMPVARRNGLARRLMADLLAGDRARGAAMTCLWAFKESFYARLGYVTFPQWRKATFAPEPLIPLLKKDLGGTVEMLSIADGFDLYWDYLQEVQARTHGMALVKPVLLRERNRRWLAVARVDGRVVGTILYQLADGGDETLIFKAERFFYTTVQGRYLLLEWLARHVDQTREVSLVLPPGELPETWWLDLQPKTTSIESALGRVLDVTRLAGIEVGPGQFTARISDPFCPWNEGCYRFASDGGCLDITPSVGAECTLSIEALTGLVYGIRDPEVFALEGWGDPSPDLQATMRSMFPACLPFLHEEF